MICLEALCSTPPEEWGTIVPTFLSCSDINEVAGPCGKQGLTCCLGNWFTATLAAPQIWHKLKQPRSFHRQYRLTLISLYSLTDSPLIPCQFYEGWWNGFNCIAHISSFIFIYLKTLLQIWCFLITNIGIRNIKGSQRLIKQSKEKNTQKMQGCHVPNSLRGGHHVSFLHLFQLDFWF